MRGFGGFHWNWQGEIREELITVPINFFPWFVAIDISIGTVNINVAKPNAYRNGSHPYAMVLKLKCAGSTQILLQRL